MKLRYLLLAIFISIGLTSPAFALLKRGEMAPDFSAQTLEGKTAKLSDLKGTPLLIEMGTTWCPACNEQAQQINKLRPELKEIGVSYVSVYLADSADSIRTHTKDEGLIAADQTLIDSGAARRNYSVFTIPRLLLVDKNFKVVFDTMVLSSNEILQRVKQHLEQE